GRAGWGSSTWCGWWRARPLTGVTLMRAAVGMSGILPPPLVERDGPGRGDVERLGARDRDRGLDVARDVGRDAGALGAEEERRLAPQVELRKRRAAVGDERHTPADAAAERYAPDRARRGAERLRAGRVGAAGRQDDGGAERVGAPDHRPEIARVRDTPELERHRPGLPARQVVAPEDPDHARRVGSGRHLGEKLGRDVLAG